MDLELILAWLGIGVLTVYLTERLLMKHKTLTLGDLICMALSTIIWPFVGAILIIGLADKVVVFRKGGDLQ